MAAMAADRQVAAADATAGCGMSRRHSPEPPPFTPPPQHSLHSLLLLPNKCEPGGHFVSHFFTFNSVHMEKRKKKKNNLFPSTAHLRAKKVGGGSGEDGDEEVRGGWSGE